MFGGNIIFFYILTWVKVTVQCCRNNKYACLISLNNWKIGKKFYLIFSEFINDLQSQMFFMIHVDD